MSVYLSYGHPVSYRDFWSVDSGESHHTLTCNSIAVANVDNEPGEIAKVIVGSFTGFLRIFGPPTAEIAQIEDSALFPSIPQSGNLLAETQLGAPILQVEAGKFISGTNDLHLAVLHPNKLGVYAVSKVAGQVEHGSQYKVTLLYEHKLKRLAFNMCYGSFGAGVSSGPMAMAKDRHYICVQSLDGTLSFFEHEVFTFSRYLPSFLLPGPLAYVPPWDSFLTISSAWNLQCFKYSSLVMTKDDASVQTQETAVGKRLSPEWSYCVGEEPIGKIQVLYYSGDPSSVRIIVPTFRHLFCFGVGGELLWCKRLDYQLETLNSYLGDSGECMSLAAAGTETGTVYIYGGVTLKWAAKVPFVPIYVNRISLGVMDGGLLFLSTDGRIMVGYLGTEPSLFIAPPIQARDLDYEAAEIELNKLRHVISETGDQNVSEAKDSTVEVKVEFEGQKSKYIESAQSEVMALIATVKIMCHAKVNDVRVNICTPRPIVCSRESVMIGDIIGRHNYQIEFYVDTEAVPSDLQCQVYVFYLSDTGVPHFVSKSGIKIPLFIVARASDQLEREAEAKLTFSMNKPIINLASLYNDFEWGPDVNTTGITFRLCGGDKVTLLASTKASSNNTSRYRVQSSSIAAVHIIFKDFLDRLSRKYNREKSDLKFSIVGLENEIPLLNEYFSEIDAHILRRRREIQIKEDLSGRAAQLRAIQRRLLIRFRDKNPIPLTQLETLLNGSLDHINDALNFMEENEKEKQKSECRLSGATRLLLHIIQIQSGKTDEEMSLLSDALSPSVADFVEDRGWEEWVFTGLTYLKSQIVTHNDFSQLDPSKLKKAIKSTFDKMKRSSQTTLTAPLPRAKPDIEPEKLIGNEIMERIASARVRTGRKRNPVLASIPEPEGEGENEAGDGPLNTITEAQEDGTAGVSFEDEAADTAPSDAILDEDNQAVPEEVPNGRVVTMLQDMPSQDSQEDNFW